MGALAEVEGWAAAAVAPLGLPEEVLRLCGALAVLYAAARYVAGPACRAAAGLAHRLAVGHGAPRLAVPLEPLEAAEVIEGGEKYDPRKKEHARAGQIPCYDPGSLDLLGFAPVTSGEEVRRAVAAAREAQRTWARSGFAQRRKLLRTLLRFTLEHMDDICRVSARDSGKPMLDAGMGEIITTCEKIRWLLAEGEQWLRPEARSVGGMMFYKRAYVEYHPVGVVGAIVPWNYPFHNVLNPLTAAVMAGNSIVIKASEHAAWSTGYYGRVIKAALAAVGAPEDLVQLVVGYGETGHALVTAGLDKIIFVGSVPIGKKVMEAAADTLTPVVMELGGKDAVIICDGADLQQATATAMRSAFQSAGQNCTGGERFFIQAPVYDRFVSEVTRVGRQMRCGHALGCPGGVGVDVGALCMGTHAAHLQGLIDDAVAKGAKVLVGGGGDAERGGQFFPPTILEGIDDSMRIWHEEVFGPVMSIVRWETADEVAGKVNNCPFGLGSAIFGPPAIVKAIRERLHVGMVAVNDFATFYMCQSLPFGGVKYSGFDRFAGVEGLRGMCYPRAVCEDRVPFIKTEVPPPLRYPTADIAYPFFKGIAWMFFSHSLVGKLSGIGLILKSFLAPKSFAKGAKSA